MLKRNYAYVLLLLTVAILRASILTACKPEATLTADEAREIAGEAYIYGFPMVVNYKTMYDGQTQLFIHNPLPSIFRRKRRDLSLRPTGSRLPTDPSIVY